MRFAVVLDLFVALEFDRRTVFERKRIDGVLQVLLLHEYALERFRIEAERRAAFQALLVGIQVDVLEVVVSIIRRPFPWSSCPAG